MKIASRLALLVLFVVSQQLSVFAQEPKYSAEVEKRIQEVENRLGLEVVVEGRKNDYSLKERMAFYHVHGISIAVVRDYKIEWVRGYGWADSALQRPVTTATLFQAGSISKSLNGVGVLKLAQDGKVNLYTDINNYLRTWKFPYDSLSKGKKINLANLLSHTAGLTVHGFPGYNAGANIPSLMQVLNGESPANTKAVRSAIEPGLRAQYSGGGTTISELLVQDVSGMPYDEYMWKNVLQPMGMLKSSYTQPPKKEKQDNHATAYNNTKPVIGQYHIYPERAAAGLWTNPSDLARYIIETQLALQGKSGKVLNQEMTRVRLTPYVDSFAAMGVFIMKRGDMKYFRHGGVDHGFVAEYIGSMDGGNGVVVMANDYVSPLLTEIVNSVAKVYDWKGVL
jgi:CubicO group peptidase (beta-lactamase class C family)